MTVMEVEDETKVFNVEDETKVINVAINHGQGQLWNASDVHRARTDHRIVGFMVGSLPRHPHQTAMMGLPLKLMPEEITLLLEKGFARAVHYPEIMRMPSKPMVDKFNDYRQKCYEEQVIAASEQRKKEIESVADKILIGKLKKFQKSKLNSADGSNSDCGLTREKVIEMECKRIQKLPEQHQLIQVFTEDPMIDSFTPSDADWSFPKSEAEKLRYAVFKDLWQEGHYLTSGIKFGGDFLVYKGDPVLFHASFIVKCVKNLKKVDHADLMTLSRLANATKKTVVLASYISNKLTYKSFQLVDDKMMSDQSF